MKPTPCLQQRICERILQCNGSIPFDEFMRMALYDQHAGYYQQATVFGSEGDFVTAADMGSWLAIGFAELIDHYRQQLAGDAPWVLIEQGGGQGRLMMQVLCFLAERDASPSRAIAVEQSPHFRQQQQMLYESKQLDVEQYASLEDIKVDAPAIVFSNELPDAFPVKCFCWQQQQFFERGVSWDGQQFHWSISDTPWQHHHDIDQAIVSQWPEGYCSELNHGLQSWQQQLSTLIAPSGGAILTLDYGYTQREYYRPNRQQGTLMGHARHQVVDDVLGQPGSCDITAHIDFTALAQTGLKEGLHNQAFLTQGAWLASSPSIQSTLQAIASTPSAQSMKLIGHAKRLMLPHAGMGETFKLLVQTSDAESLSPSWLQSMNRLERLCL